MASHPLQRTRVTLLLMTLLMTTALLTTNFGSALPLGKTSPGPSIKTRYGQVQGLSLSMPSPLGPVALFLGIPYATPPVGINRFSPTRNPQSWPGTRMADKHGPACPQRFPTDLANETEALTSMSKVRRDYLLHVQQTLAKNQSEDCLHLNIYAPLQVRPVSSAADRLPVMVFIHGESFDWGSSHLYDGSVLSSYTNVVVVTLNFRLGVLGFLNVGRWPKGKLRLANFGLMDQVAALHWIQENIAEFGGDPSRVTLVGFGAGAACIHHLMTSPAVVSGLFHRGIVMSGSALAPWALVNDANDVALQVAQAADCVHLVGDRSDSETIMNCLREAPLERIDQAAAKIATLAMTRSPGSRHFRTLFGLFGPSIDGVVIRGTNSPSPVSSSSSSASAPGPRKRSSDEGRVSYDFLFGVSGMEASYHLSEAVTENGLDGMERDLLLRKFVAETYRYHQTEIFLTLANEYTDWERTLQHPLSIRDSIIELLSDGQFVAPAIMLGDTLTSMEKNSFFYVMDPAVIQRPQALTGLELSLLFGSPLLLAAGLVDPQQHGRNYTKQDAAYSEAVMALFANFARSGNPNEPQEEKLRLSKERNRFKGVVWEQYEKRQRKYLEIGLKPKMKSHFRAHRMALLLQLLPELQRTGQHEVLQGHGILSPEGLAEGPSLPAWVNGSYIDVSKQRAAPKDGVTCVVPQSNTPTASPSTSNSSTTNGTAVVNIATNTNSESSVYSTALSVTIAIGCSLLILNVLTFAGLYYRRDRRRQLQQQFVQQQHHPSGSLMMLQRSISDTSQQHPVVGNGILRGRSSLSEHDCVQGHPSMVGSNCGTILKAGSTSTNSVITPASRQRCCDFAPPATADIEIGGPSDLALLDIRYDTSSPIPPDKNFL